MWKDSPTAAYISPADNDKSVEGLTVTLEFYAERQRVPFQHLTPFVIQLAACSSSSPFLSKGDGTETTEGRKPSTTLGKSYIIVDEQVCVRRRVFIKI